MPLLELAMLAALQSESGAEALPDARWKRVPSFYERALAYPDLAGARGISGAAILKCRINDIGSPTGCSIYSESPPGYGFGKAAMSLRSKMSFYPPAPGEGPWVLVRLSFDPDPKKAFHIY